VVLAKERLDKLVAATGLVESRELAQRLILAGEVLVNGHPMYKAGVKVALDAEIVIKARPRFVSRGGEKLEGAFAAFDFQVAGLCGIDVGASTGGFTDCLLQHGAKHVLAVDVGRAQVHERIRRDERVTIWERCNVRYLEPDTLPFAPAFAVFDVSFISLELVMPPVVAVLEEGGQMITLVKPQFEAGRSEVGAGGVVRDAAVRAKVVSRIQEFGENKLSLRWLGCVESPLTGPAGNVEYLAWWQKK
jgi:23S rRNA (cytidine1920-2'-O)/16S rRNA (cytidine1409-2'-O)-methyltransferase